MKKVALVLSSGGARGFAYIGAIEELERRGYTITSVAGCSIGALIGGVYASGKMQEFKDWLFALDNKKVLSLLDVSISKSYLVKGDRLMNTIMEVVPDVNIEDLKIPYTAVATDLYTGEEIVFTKGKLFDAIRASISIPTTFRPVKYGHRTLVDGGLVNTIPLNRVSRTDGDILVGFNVNEIDATGINKFLKEMFALNKDMNEYSQDSLQNMEKVAQSKNKTLLEKIKEAGSLGENYLKYSIQMNSRQKNLKEEGEKQRVFIEADDNYYSIITRCFSITNHVVAKMMIETCPPDVLVQMPLDALPYSNAYAKGKEISEIGRKLMAEALDEYENKRL